MRVDVREAGAADWQWTFLCTASQRVLAPRCRVFLGGGHFCDIEGFGPAAPPSALRRVTAATALEEPLAALREMIGWPVEHAEEAAALGVTWPRGVLLHGPPGCGKTAVVRAIAGELGAYVHELPASAVFGAHTGESERRLRDAFAAAAAAAAPGRPAVLLLDEADALAPRRDAHRPHEARVVAQLLTLLDGAASASGAAGRLTVVAATSRPHALDPALRRPGRLDHEVAVPVPSARARAAILALHAARLPLAPDVDLETLSSAAIGYSGADLAALCREAAMRALVRPSITRGWEAELAPAAWGDIGGLERVKARLRQAVEWPLAHAGAFQRLGLAAPRGVLLHGPPGCCKTTLARAAASATNARLQVLSGAQLFSAYVGEGEARLRAAFARARQAAPAILFIDEIDAVGGRRENDGGGSGASARLLSALLTEMDGLELAIGVLVLAATNRPAALDAALVRPGRLDLLLYVPPPDAPGRLATLRIHTRDMPLAPDVDLPALAADTERFTGAELEALCREAALAALREDVASAAAVAARHFAAARAAAAPALTDERLREHEAWGSRHKP
ncbi:hypothetical protein WJX81_003048 [Elliptochloris bilobata]|uniref:AAA+ ATPase domain-containing protein n=1 Tax=Elliptochloris bilobata TaxID=381761 RepID=A0AAW1SDG7_9CHLO